MSIKRIQTKKSDNILGDTQYYLKDPLGFLQENQKKIGNIFGFRLAHRTIYFVNEPDLITYILKGNHKNYKKSLAYRKLSLMLGNGLFTSDGSFWLRQRRLAQPAFHKERIEGYFDIILRHSKDMIHSLQGKNEFLLGSEITRLTLKIISETLLGLQLDKKDTLIEEKLPGIMRFMIRRITSSLNVPLWIPISQNRDFKKSSSQIRSMIEEMINEKRSNPGGNDLLTDLINVKDADTGEVMSNKQLTDEVLTFFLAGHETTAVSAFWTILLLYKNHSCRKILEKELLNVSLNNLKMSDLSTFKYLDAVIKESMRLYSPVWVLGREALGNDMLGEFNVKKGDSIIFSPFMIHRHESYWKEGHRFLPERFLQDSSDIVKNTYIPFGSGPRICIGNSFAMMELKVICIAIFTSLKMSFENDEMPGFDCSLTLRPSEDRKVIIH